MNMMTTRRRRPNGHPRAHLAAMIAFAPDHEIRATIHLLIEALDARQIDPDLEPEEDRCEAGDDMVAAGAVVRREFGREPDRWHIGDEDDGEPRHVPVTLNRRDRRMLSGTVQ